MKTKVTETVTLIFATVENAHLTSSLCLQHSNHTIYPNPHPRNLHILKFIFILSSHLRICKIRGSANGIASLRAGGPRCRISCPIRVKNFSCRPDRLWDPIQRVPEAFSKEVKRQGREFDHSPPTSSDVKKTWIYTSTSPYIFMVYFSIGQVHGPLLYFAFTRSCLPLMNNSVALVRERTIPTERSPLVIKASANF
jgi:hypothetical protein